MLALHQRQNNGRGVVQDAKRVADVGRGAPQRDSKEMRHQRGGRALQTTEQTHWALKGGEMK